LSSRRRVAAHVAEATCPRCGAARAASQAYCLECGLRLPVAVGALAAWRRRWVRGLGWYPGDWVWLALLAGAVAAGGAAVAIGAGGRHAAAAAATTYVAPAPKLSPSVAPHGPNGRTVWPQQLGAWTVVLRSTPSARGRAGLLAVASRAVHGGLPRVGVLDSTRFGSLHPGYYLLFSGVYGAADDAEAALQTVRARGYGGAYVARVAP
jgi:hypothetical protein